ATALHDALPQRAGAQRSTVLADFFRRAGGGGAETTLPGRTGSATRLAPRLRAGAVAAGCDRPRSPRRPVCPARSRHGMNAPESTEVRTSSLSDQLATMRQALTGSPVARRIAWASAAILGVIVATSFGQILLNRWNRPFYDA